MTHQAIARKWRPRVFEEIVGQTHVTRTLQNAIRLGRIHHAFLLTGARGVGKTSAARILARALNCEQGPAENPCNECSRCTQMLSGSFPDLLEIDAASHNSVDSIRDLVEKVRYTPQQGRYKVYIIDEVHMVSNQGFNALLKTLEEPPAHVIFILATTDPQKLLDTVVSRCQRFDFKMIPVRTIYERLHFVAEQEGVAVPDASLMVISREGGGSMRDAQSLLDQVLSFSGEGVTEDDVAEILGFIDRSILYDVLEATLQARPAPALEALARVSGFGYDVRTFGEQLLEGVRNVMVVRQVPEAGRLLDLPDQEVTRLSKLAQDASEDRLQQQFDILAGAVAAIQGSEQPMLLLEMAAVKMASVRPLVPVQRLVDRLEALERRIRKSGGSPGPASGNGGRRASATSPPTQPPPRPDPRESAPVPGPPPSAPGTPPGDEDPFAPGPPIAEAPPTSPPSTNTANKPAPSPAPTPQARTAPVPSSTHDSTGGGSVFDKLAAFGAPDPSAARPPQRTAPSAGLSPTSEERSPTSDAATSNEPAPAPDPSPPQAAGASVSAPLSEQEEHGATEGLTVDARSEAQAPTGEDHPPGPPAPPEDSSTTHHEPPAQEASSSKQGPNEGSPPLPEDPEGSALCDGPRWRRFVHELTAREGFGPVAAPLAHAAFLGADEQVIYLGFRSPSGLQHLVEIVDTPMLRGALDETFGDKTSLSGSVDTEGLGGRSLVDELQRQKTEKTKALREQATAHPGVQRSLEAFPGAEIARVVLPEKVEIDDVG